MHPRSKMDISVVDMLDFKHITNSSPSLSSGPGKEPLTQKQKLLWLVPKQPSTHNSSMGHNLWVCFGNLEVATCLQLSSTGSFQWDFGIFLHTYSRLATTRKASSPKAVHPNSMIYCAERSCCAWISREYGRRDQLSSMHTGGLGFV